VLSPPPSAGGNLSELRREKVGVSEIGELIPAAETVCQLESLTSLTVVHRRSGPQCLILWDNGDVRKD
jgi:hypothetical protein